MPSDAVIVAVPTPELIAIPWEPVELPMIATVAGDALHVTTVVMSGVVPSVYVPVALNA